MEKKCDWQPNYIPAFRFERMAPVAQFLVKKQLGDCSFGCFDGEAKDDLRFLEETTLTTCINSSASSFRSWSESVRNIANKRFFMIISILPAACGANHFNKA